MPLPSELSTLLPAGETLVAADPIGGSGSNRSYWRLRFASGLELIGTIGTNREENRAFIYLAEKLAAGGTNVPRVPAVSPDEMAYVQTSVGISALFDCLERRDLIAAAMRLLARAQQTPGIDYGRCFPVAAMDRRAIMWDLNYFKYCFLKTCPGLEINEPALEDDFEHLTSIILSAEPRGFMVRDFQSRNVMVGTDGHTLSLIDFQGGRLGPAHYDVASFLWQARAGFPSELRSEMVGEFCRARGIDETQFRCELPYFIVLRLLQALGAYGFRGRFERKEHFLRSIPQALASLDATLADMPLPAIKAHIKDVICAKKFGIQE